MTETKRAISWPTVAFISLSFLVFLLVPVSGLSGGSFLRGLSDGTVLLLAVVIFSLAAFLSALLNKSLDSSARSIWAVIAACSGVADIVLIFVIITLICGP
jgi:Zn-dependent protease